MILSGILLSLLALTLPMKSNVNIGMGEDQVYVVHYKWGLLNADVARAYWSVDSTSLQGVPAYKARIYGRSAKFCEAIIKIREDFQSWFSPSDMRPIKSFRKAVEGKFEGGESYEYDWEEGKLRMTIDVNEKVSHKEFEIEDGLLDVPTLFFFFHNIDVSKLLAGSSFSVKLAVGDNIENIGFKYVGIERLNVKGLGNLSTHRFLIKVSTGNTFDTKSDISVYATDEGDSILPVYFDAPMRLGRVVIRLLPDSFKRK